MSAPKDELKTIFDIAEKIGGDSELHMLIVKHRAAVEVYFEVEGTHKERWSNVRALDEELRGYADRLLAGERGEIVTLYVDKLRERRALGDAINRTNYELAQAAHTKMRETDRAVWHYIRDKYLKGLELDAFQRR